MYEYCRFQRRFPFAPFPLSPTLSSLSTLPSFLPFLPFFVPPKPGVEPYVLYGSKMFPFCSLFPLPLPPILSFVFPTSLPPFPPLPIVSPKYHVESSVLLRFRPSDVPLSPPPRPFSSFPLSCRFLVTPSPSPSRYGLVVTAY